MNKKCRTALLAAAVPGLAAAQAATSFQCTYGDLERRIEILTEPGLTVPCEVHYYKDVEAPGERQVLYSASSEEGYCERKTEEFIAKLEGWGWSCSAGAAGPEPEPLPENEIEESPEAMPGTPDDDETDDLIPPEASVSQV